MTPPSRPDPAVTCPAMSVEFSTPSSIATDEVDVPEDPADVFEAVVADPSLCCQQCYRRLRSRRQFPDLAGYEHGHLLSYVDAVLPPGAEWELLGTEYYTTEPVGDRLEEMHPPADRPESAHGCSFCGAVRPHRSPSTRSRSEAIEAAAGIAMTLSELGVAHDPLALFVEVSDGKCDPDLAGDDFETFRRAVDRAIRAGRRPR